MPFAPGRGSLQPFEFVTKAAPPTVPSTVGIFSNSLGSTNGGWQGYQLRIIIAVADLLPAVGSTSISVSFLFASSASAAVIDSAYIGEQALAGNPYNFDGNQAQLTFNGNASVAGITGAQTITSDFVSFIYNNASTPLIVSIHFSGTAADIQSAVDLNVAGYYQLVSDSQTGLTIPSGSFTPISSTALVVTLINAGTSAVPAPLRSIASTNAFSMITAAGQLPILAGAKAISAGVFSPAGKVTLSARGVVIGLGLLARLAGAASLAARSAATGSARAAISTTQALALFARSNAAGIARAYGLFNASLRVAGGSHGAGYAGISGKVPVSTLTAVVSMARAIASINATLHSAAGSNTAARAAGSFRSALRTAAMSVGLGTAPFSGAINLRAFGKGFGIGRVPIVVRASLQAVTTGVSAARASLIGKLALVARTAAVATSMAAISTLTAGFMALKASSSSRATGRALSAGALKLSSSGSFVSQGIAAPAGKIQIFARSAAMMVGRAAGAFKAGLASFSRGVGKGIAFPAGFATLISSATASSKALAAASFIAGLKSRSSGQGKAKTQVTGVLTLTTSSPSRSTSIAKPSLLVPFTALSSFGRSVANSVSILLIKKPIFIDPHYIVKYPPPVRAMKYPDPVIVQLLR